MKVFKFAMGDIFYEFVIVPIKNLLIIGVFLEFVQTFLITLNEKVANIFVTDFIFSLSLNKPVLTM